MTEIEKRQGDDLVHRVATGAIPVIDSPSEIVMRRPPTSDIDILIEIADTGSIPVITGPSALVLTEESEPKLHGPIAAQELGAAPALLASPYPGGPFKRRRGPARSAVSHVANQTEWLSAKDLMTRAAGVPALARLSRGQERLTYLAGAMLVGTAYWAFTAWSAVFGG